MRAFLGFLKKKTRINLDIRPCPTVMASGICGDNFSHYHLEFDENIPMKKKQTKPPFRVPAMKEIEDIPWNGLTVASTFSGAGGSCLGYRMAGYRVLWANEFVPIAQECYKANHPNSILDSRDIKDIIPEDILRVTNLKKGELDLFDGSPPCQAFSMAGKREKGWGSDKSYEHGVKQKNEDLFFEYIRLLEGLAPKVFVAENVAGLAQGKAIGYFRIILRKLRKAGYKVDAKIVNAQWLGVPQARKRLIIMGVRKDLNLSPVFPKPLPYCYSVGDACPWMAKATYESGGFSKTECINVPSPTITATQCRLTGNEKFSPSAVEAKIEPPNIENYAIGKEYDNLLVGDNSKKYFQLYKVHPGKPFPTVCASHGAGSVAGPVHPNEKRKFTIEEVQRICAFPDDFQLFGSYAQQWERLGNSVPPVMMRHIALSIAKGVLLNIDDSGSIRT